MYTLDKQVFTKLDTGWLAPNGDWYLCDYMEHLALADDLWHLMYSQWEPSCERMLLDMGWCEIHCVTYLEHGFLFNFKRHLTPEQIRVIRPVVENNWDRLIKSSKWDLKEEFER